MRTDMPDHYSDCAGGLAKGVRAFAADGEAVGARRGAASLPWSGILLR
jgi:hypothetical protein